MLIKTVRRQFWKKAAISYAAVVIILVIANNVGNNQILLFTLLPIAYLLFGTGEKCPNCHNKVQKVRTWLSVPWCPKSCYTCGKNLSRR